MAIMKEKLRKEAKELEKEGKEEEFMKKVAELGEVIFKERGIFRKK